MIHLMLNLDALTARDVLLLVRLGWLRQTGRGAAGGVIEYELTRTGAEQLGNLLASEPTPEQCDPNAFAELRERVEDLERRLEP